MCVCVIVSEQLARAQDEGRRCADEPDDDRPLVELLEVAPATHAACSAAQLMGDGSHGRDIFCFYTWHVIAIALTHMDTIVITLCIGSIFFGFGTHMS